MAVMVETVEMVETMEIVNTAVSTYKDHRILDQIAA